MIDNLTTEGIPQSTAPPSMVPAFGENPWDVDERELAAKRAEDYRATQSKIDGIALDPTSYFAGKDMGRGDPKKMQALAINSAFMDFAQGEFGEPVPMAESDLSRKLIRQRIARERFDGRGADSEEAFNAEVVKDAQGRKDRGDLYSFIGDEASKGAVIGAATVDNPATWEATRDAMRSKPGYKAESEADYFEAWHETQRVTRDKIADFAPELAQVWQAMKGGGGGAPSAILKELLPFASLDGNDLVDELQKQDAGTVAFGIYSGMPAEQRGQFMDSLAMLAKTLPKEERPEFFANLNLSGGRAVDDLGRGAGSWFSVKGLEQSLNKEIAGSMGPLGGNDAEKAQAARNVETIQADRLAQRNFVDDVRKIERADYDPIKSAFHSGDPGFFEGGIYAAPGAIASSAMAALPVVGGPAMFVTMEADAYGSLRDGMLAGGASEKDASAFASKLSFVAAVPMALLERLQAKAIVGKLPFLEKAMTALGDKIASKALRFGVRATVGAVEESAIEMTQDLIPPVVQDIGNALSADVPDVQWNGPGGVLDGFGERSASMLVTMLPLAIIGAAGGVSMDARARAFAEASPSMRQALGISQADSAAIDEAAGRGLSSLNAAVDVALERSNPGSDEAKAAMAEVDKQVAEQEEAMKAATAAGIIPRFVRNSDGWTVLDSETGGELGRAKDAAGAFRIASDQTKAVDRANSDQVAYLATMLQAAELTDQTDTEGKRKTSTQVNPFEKVTTTQQAALSEADEARVMAQATAKERLNGGDGSMSAVVFGQSLTRFKQGVRETVNKLNAGASVLTVFHEEAHGFYREALTTGRLTQAETILAIQSLDSVLAGKTTKAGEQLRFLPENLDTLSDADLATAVDEAVSELMEAEILRTRKSKGDKRVPGGIISRNLSAMARLAPGASQKFSAFADAVRGFFGLAFSRAVTLKKGIREGAIKEADIEAFTSKLFGLDAQDEFDGQVDETTADILGEGDPFSLGPAKMADLLSRDAINRIGDPKAKAAAMRKMAINLAALKRDRDEIGIAFGKGYKRRAIEDPRKTESINREARVREGFRRAELEDAAYAKHEGILSNPDLTKLRTQPVHEALSDPTDPLRGRLVSKAQAIKRTWFDEKSHGDYDGADGISRTMFGGNNMPDQAAQELFDEGLISAPTPDAMWDAMKKEAASVAKMKDYQKAAEADLKAARDTAKQEASAWKKERLAEEKANYSPKARLLRAMAMLDGIINALPIEQRARVGGHTQLAKLGTDEARLKYLQGRIEKADEVVEKWLSKEYGRMLDKLFELAVPVKGKAGEKPKGKIGADAHSMFRVLGEARGWTAEEGEAHAVALESLIADGKLTPAQEAHAMLEANLVRQVAGWKDADAAARADAVQNLTDVFERGYAATKLAKLFQKEDREVRRGMLRQDTGKSGAATGRAAMDEDQKGLSGFKEKAKEYMLGLYSFEQLLGYVFGEKSPSARMFADMERHAGYQKIDKLAVIDEKIEQLFLGLTGGDALAAEKLRFALSERRQAVSTDGKAQTPIGIKIKEADGSTRYLSQMEAIDATLQWRQTDGKRHMEGRKDENGNPTGTWHYTQADIDAIEAQLSPEAKSVRQFLSDEIGTEWDEINPLFKQLNFINLPRIPNYWMISVKPEQGADPASLDPVTGMPTTGSGFTPGSLKSRGTAIAEPDFKDALGKFIGHKRQIEHWLAYAHFTAEMAAVMNNRELQNAAQEKAGKEASSLLRKWNEYFAKGGNQDAAASLAAMQGLSKITNRLAASALVGRVSVLAVQATQLGAAAYQMPAGAYIKRLAKLTTGQMGWGDALGSDYIQRRMKQMPPFVQQAMEGLKAGKPSTLKHQVTKLGKLIGGADALFTAGTYAMILDYQLSEMKKAGITGPEALKAAHDEAARLTDQVAQPARPGTRSYFENTSGNPAMRLGWAFASEARQKMALTAYSLLSKDSPGQKAKTIAITLLVQGAAATIIRAALRDMRDGGDDDALDERNWSLAQLGLSTLTGPLKGIPFLGDAAQSAVFSAFGQWSPDGNLLGNLGNAAKGGTSMFGMLVGSKEGSWDKALKDSEAILSGMGAFSQTAASATSVAHIVRDVFSFVKTGIEAATD